MLKHLAGVAVVLIGATIAWFILGGTIAVRTQGSDSVQRDQLAAQWGSAHVQNAPKFWLAPRRLDKKGHPYFEATALPTASSRIDVDLALDPRQKGLLWYNTYAVGFTATYRVAIPAPDAHVHVDFSFPSDDATYDDVTLAIDGKRIPVTSASGVITASVPPGHARTSTVTVRYRSHGIGRWTYQFGEGIVSVHDFVLTMNTNFRAIDFPPKTLSPTVKQETPGGWRLTWNYRDLVGGFGVGMAFPQRLQPGPLAERITLWAPLSLLFYVFVMLVITTLRRIVLRVPPAVRVHRRPHPGRLGVRDLLGGFDVPHRVVLAARRRLAVRGRRSGARAVLLLDPLLVRALRRRLQRAVDHRRRDRHAVHHDADHGAHRLVPTLCVQARLAGLFFAVVVVGRGRAHVAFLGRTHGPLSAIRKVCRLTDRVVGDDVEHDILRAVVCDDVRFAGLENERVARFDGDDVVELPMRAVRMVRIRRRARRQAGDLDVERMALVEVHRLRHAAQRFGDLLAGARERAFGRRPRELVHVVRVDSAHRARLSASGHAAPAREPAFARRVSAV